MCNFNFANCFIKMRLVKALFLIVFLKDAKMWCNTHTAHTHAHNIHCLVFLEFKNLNVYFFAHHLMAQSDLPHSRCSFWDCFCYCVFFLYSLCVSLSLSLLLARASKPIKFIQHIHWQRKRIAKYVYILCSNCGYIDIMYIAIVCVHKSLTSFFSTFSLFLFSSCSLCLHKMYTKTLCETDKMIQKQRENKRMGGGILLYVFVYIRMLYVCHEVSLWRILGHVQSPPTFISCMIVESELSLNHRNN